ncbi:MAG: hypothetical protein IJO21_06075 [Oscillospiraceae bacterium]|nr:hypothetical protein [Oscillospiraceae bacterium]MBQ7130587.1 hypothetical protein [Oscillospiraceae bacterium]
MNKKQSKRRRDIKSKLMAAICMLLVSSIMMVSTTYAWFTLSTAPEVTGINTAVGANGNLEMALQRPDGDSTQIASTTADSMEVKSKLESNITWGNLVDLADANYGLSNITLYPSQLNTVAGSEEGKLRIAVAPLSTPRYGYDGRITKLVQETYSAIYDGTSFSGRDLRGVRGIGLATGASAREVAYNTALAAASSATSQAQINANASLSDNGVALADIAMAHGMPQGETESYDDTDKAAIQSMITGLEASLAHIEDAMLQYILAASVGAASDDTYEKLVEDFAADTVTLANYSSIANVVTPAVLSGDTGYIAIYNATKAKVTTAQTELNKLTGGTYTWQQVSAALTPLVNMESDNMTINGKTIDYAKEHKDELLQSVIDDDLTLTLGTGSGVYADIADFCGDYSAFFRVPVSYGGMSIEVDTTMNADTGLTNPYLKATANAISYTSDGNTVTAVMNEYYGYIVDLAFRTNAAGSHLQIQTEGVDRIYNGNDLNEETMGHGATMSFKSDSTNFPATSVENLMKAIRIVFFDTDSQDIITYGKLDAVNKSTQADGTITMPIVLTDKDGVAKVDAEGNADPKIMALDQNVIHELSVMVYLDGNSVTNEDVAYDAQSGKSMTGTMNLQFSSTANLVPMEYADLRNGTDSGDEGNGEGSLPAVTDTITPTVTIADGLTGVSVSDVAVTDSGYGFTVTGYDSAAHTVTATITTASGSSEAALTETSGYFLFTSAEEVTAVTVNVAAK